MEVLTFLVRNVHGPVELETLCHMPSFIMEGIGGRLRFQGTCIPLTPVYNQVYKYRELIIMLFVVTEIPFKHVKFIVVNSSNHLKF